ncbi:hypothetical protein [Macrococcus equipercicus]|uniref:Uncharacterized protein n=1 Tax=Macrococcus equipercicus TaxID=69967 RepID=A0A9Q9BKS7_9STAP|nr:hypothetical protein [Macrococcus equipercicus]KAA1037701.1 hypothetical protein ERX35_009075 [Macrococcus equipercicus]UTH13413.1 hypothetical protein KFV11_09280 [Macrococcus equipercicus]
MNKNLVYIALIAVNLVLITLLFMQLTEGWMHKLLQILIVVVTFTLFRMYVKEREFIKENKEDGER